MDLLVLFIGVLIILACTFFIINPFFQNQDRIPSPFVQTQNDPVEKIYSAVNELEMDFWMKKISAADFDSLKQSYYLFASQNMLEESKNNSRLPSCEDETDKAIEAELLLELKKLRKAKNEIH